MPIQGGWWLKKDLIMPAAAGICFAEMRPGLFLLSSGREQIRRGDPKINFQPCMCAILGSLAK
ncbi:hypothetical protein BHT94_10020 [Bacillus licheniformis]|nr:hypothetical protein BHT94_10020 [Bacillus licheniformis]